MATRLNLKISMDKTTQSIKLLKNIELFILNGGWIIWFEPQVTRQFDCLYCLSDRLGHIRNVRTIRRPSDIIAFVSLLCHFALGVH